MDMTQHSAFARVCRACLLACPEGAAMTSLFNSDFELTSNATELLTLVDITIDPNDTLPQQICQKCSDSLKDALAFRQTCERSHRYLQHVCLTQSDISPQNLFTDLQHFMSDDVTESTFDSSEHVEVKMESDKFESNTNSILKIESVNTLTTEDSEDTSTNDFLYFTVEKNDETPNIQEQVNASMTRLHGTPTESITRKQGKDKLTPAEIRLRDLIFKTDGNKSNKKGSPGQAVALEPHQVMKHERFTPVTTTQSATIETFQSVKSWRPVATEKRKTKVPGDNNSILKESIQRYLTMLPKSTSTAIRLPKKDNISRDELDCKICDKTYSSNHALRAHMQRHAPSAVCEHCGRKFGSKSELTFHCMSSHGLERNYHCGHCSYQAMNRHMLVEHIRLHTGERPYTCETCGMAFRRKDILRQHRLRHFGRKFKCDECDKRYYQLGDLNAHVNLCHLKLPQRRFHCTQPGCDVSYVKIEHIRNHLFGTHNIPRDQQGRLKTTKNRTTP